MLKAYVLIQDCETDWEYTYDAPTSEVIRVYRDRELAESDKQEYEDEHGVGDGESWTDEDEPAFHYSLRIEEVELV